MLFIAMLAIILPLFFVVALRLPAKIGMTISAIAVGLGALFFWEMTPLALGASVAQGVHRAATILLILFGAITLLKTMENTGALQRIKFGFHEISKDMRVQTVLVAFAFICLLEGVSGFGTPAIVATPLLMVLGFRPLTAATLALFGDTVACTFGAVGTPLIVGLENVPNYSNNLAWVVGAEVAKFDLIIATLLPIALVSILVFSFGKQSLKGKFHAVKQILPWSILVGLSYSLTAFVIARAVGPEFAAIIGGAVSLIVGTITAKNGFLIPKKAWRHYAGADISEEATPDEFEKLPIWKAWLPYVAVIVLLLVSRTVPAIKNFLSTNLTLGWNNIFGIEQISSSWAILYSPGTILFLAATIAALVGAKSLKPLLSGSKDAAKSASGAMLSLVPTLIMVQIFTNSGINASELAAMPIFIGQALVDLFGNLWAAAAPFLASIGAFIAGSATVSTLTLGPVQANIAQSTDLPVVTILALQMIGAAAGNAIAIHNVVAASTVVNLKHREGEIIRKLIIPTLGYLILAAVIGFLVVNVLR